MSYMYNTDLYLVQYPFGSKSIMSKKEIQNLFTQSDFFETLKIYKIDLIQQNLILNKKLASKKFLQERGTK